MNSERRCDELALAALAALRALRDHPLYTAPYNPGAMPALAELRRTLQEMTTTTTTTTTTTCAAAASSAAAPSPPCATAPVHRLQQPLLPRLPLDVLLQACAWLGCRDLARLEACDRWCQATAVAGAVRQLQTTAPQQQPCQQHQHQHPHQHQHQRQRPPPPPLPLLERVLRPRVALVRETWAGVARFVAMRRRAAGGARGARGRLAALSEWRLDSDDDEADGGGALAGGGGGRALGFALVAAAAAAAVASESDDEDGERAAVGWLCATRARRAGGGGGGALAAPGPPVLGRALRALSAGPLRVVSLSAGYGHVAAITADGGVYTFGDGEIGQLGHGSEDNALLPRRVGGALGGVRAVAVAAGSEHTAVVGEGGEVFTFGDGEYAPLGHGDEENALAPRLVAGLAGRVVVGVAAGWRHTAVVTEAGELWTFGRGWQGRLGHGDIENRLVPTRVAAFGPGAGEERAASVSAGAGHTLVATELGRLWTFGGGGEGQLGHGDHEDQLLPKAVVRFDGLHVVGDDDDDGRRRGEEEEEDQRHQRARPREMEEEEVRVVAVDADARHSVVLDAAGRVFTFGFGEGRRLGHADEGSRVCPTLVGALRASETVVVAVAAGAGFTAALSSSGRIWTSTGGLSELST